MMTIIKTIETEYRTLQNYDYNDTFVVIDKVQPPPHSTCKITEVETFWYGAGMVATF